MGLVSIATWQFILVSMLAILLTAGSLAAGLGHGRVIQDLTVPLEDAAYTFPGAHLLHEPVLTAAKLAQSFGTNDLPVTAA